MFGTSWLKPNISLDWLKSKTYDQKIKDIQKKKDEIKSKLKQYDTRKNYIYKLLVDKPPNDEPLFKYNMDEVLIYQLHFKNYRKNKFYTKNYEKKQELIKQILASNKTDEQIASNKTDEQKQREYENAKRIASNNPQYLKFFRFGDIDVIYHNWLYNTDKIEAQPRKEPLEDTDKNRRVFLDEYKKEWKEMNNYLAFAYKFYDDTNRDISRDMNAFYDHAIDVNEPHSFNYRGIYRKEFRILFSPTTFLYGNNGAELTGTSMFF